MKKFNYSVKESMFLFLQNIISIESKKLNTAYISRASQNIIHNLNKDPVITATQHS
jgi:hypothetical protein